MTTTMVAQELPTELIAEANTPFVYRRFSNSMLDAVSKEFYVSTMQALNAAKIPYLVGGAYAFAIYAGIERHTKDFDIFVKKEDADRILDTLSKVLKCKIDRTFHWLYKAIFGENFIDIIFSSGNNVAKVDDTWFEKAGSGNVLGIPAKLIPAEEMIWSKGYIMERERFDGADVAHVLRGWGANMDWQRLIARYSVDWRVLFSHLVLFGFIYPNEKHAIPSWVMQNMTQKILEEQQENPQNSLICQGTLLSRQQYLKDIAEWNYADARAIPREDSGNPIMTDEEISHWTAAAFSSHKGNP